MPKFPWQIISQLKCFARGNFHMFMTAAMRGRKSNKREFHLCHPISSSLWQTWKCFVHNREAAHSLGSNWFGREEKVEVRKDQMQVVWERKQPIGFLYLPCNLRKMKNCFLCYFSFYEAPVHSLQQW